MRWQVWYSDGLSISSEDATPFSIPEPYRDGVQVIIQVEEEGRWKTLSGFDYYMWDDRGNGAKWFGGDREGLSTYLRRPGYKCVLIGEFIDKKLFNEIFNRAREEFGEKGTFEPDERHPE